MALRGTADSGIARHVRDRRVRQRADARRGVQDEPPPRPPRPRRGRRQSRSRQTNADYFALPITLLSNAETAEDRLEHVVRRACAGHFLETRPCLGEIGGDEFLRRALARGRAGAPQRSACRRQQVHVARVRDRRGIVQAIACRQVAPDLATEVVESVAVLRGYRQRRNQQVVRLARQEANRTCWQRPDADDGGRRREALGRRRSSGASDRARRSPGRRPPPPRVHGQCPSASTASAGAGVQAAVSTSVIATPSMSITSVTRSRVVPGMSVTIARPAPARRLKRLDFPELGRPMIATCAPSRTSRPRPASASSVSICCATVSISSAADPASTKWYPSSGKSSDASRRADQLEQRRVDFANPARQRAFELIERGPRLERRHRFDQIVHRLGLHQIDAAVQVGAKGELAGLGEPRSRPHRRFDDGAEHHGASVRADLDDVLAGVGMRAGKEGHDGPIDRLAVHAKFGQRRAPGSPASRLESRVTGDTRACDPLIRTTPIPPRPGGVAIATMVSAGENINC